MSSPRKTLHRFSNTLTTPGARGSFVHGTQFYSTGTLREDQRSPTVNVQRVGAHLVGSASPVPHSHLGSPLDARQAVK